MQMGLSFCLNLSLCLFLSFLLALICVDGSIKQVYEKGEREKECERGLRKLAKFFAFLTRSIAERTRIHMEQISSTGTKCRLLVF